MRDALHLEIVVGARHVVEDENRTVASVEELLQGQNLAAIPERVPGEQSQFRQRIEDDPRRIETFDIRQDLLGGFAQLNLGRMEHRVVVIR